MKVHYQPDSFSFGRLMTSGLDELDTIWGSQRQIVVVLLGFLTVLIGYRLLFPKVNRSKLPPGPRRWPVIGNMHLLGGENMHLILWKLAQKYGPIMSLRLGSHPLVVVSSAEAASLFCKTHDKSFADRPPSLAVSIFTNNYRDIIGAPCGSYWRHLRKICTFELFTPKRLESFRPARTKEMNGLVTSVMADVQQGKVVELDVKLVSVATNNITRMVLNKRYFGIDTTSQQEAHVFRDLMYTLLRCQSTMVVGDFLPYLKWISKLSGFEAHMIKVKEQLDNFYGDVFKMKHAGLARRSEDETEGEVKDFVDVLLSMPSEDGVGQLSDFTIKAVIQDMLVAGSDTSSTTLEWAMAEFVRHPDVAKRLQDEIDSVVGRDHTVEETDIPNLPYLQAVVKEVFRLHPPTPLLLPHMSTEACTVAGYDIPNQTRLFVNVYAIHRDPAVWDRPLVFDPERFMKNPEIDMKGQHFCLMPFGAGRRICPAMFLGILLVQIGLARLAHSFNFSLPNGQNPDQLDMSEKLGITMPRAKPLKVVAQPRLPSHLY